MGFLWGISNVFMGFPWGIYGEFLWFVGGLLKSYEGLIGGSLMTFRDGGQFLFVGRDVGVMSVKGSKRLRFIGNS
jgi:hypothetical protein